MKRRFWIIALFAILAVLSACASADMEPITEEPVFDSSMRFQWDALRFRPAGEADILEGIPTVETDVFLVRSRTGLEPLDDTQKAAYLTLLDTFDTLRQTTAFQYADIASYSLSEFSAFMEEADLSLDVATVFTFQRFQEEMDTMDSTYATIVSKETYLSYRLDRALTDSETEYLSLLQEWHSAAMNRDSSFTLQGATYTMWEDWVTETLDHTFSETEQIGLEQVFDLLLALRPNGS
jgi:hypothetical protein